MSYEFLDYLEDILDAMQKAQAMLEDVTFNLHLVWDTVKNRIPEVKPKIQQILDDHKDRA